MRLLKILGLERRPHSAADFRVAVEKARARKAATEAEIARLEAEHAEALVNGDDAAADAAAAELAAARTVASEAAAVVPVLEGRLRELEAAEQAEAYERHIAETRAATEAFVRWWRERYPQLAREIAEGLELERRALHLRASDAGKLPPSVTFDASRHQVDSPADVVWPWKAEGFVKGNIGDWVRLPGVDGPGMGQTHHASFWPRPQP